MRRAALGEPARPSLVGDDHLRLLPMRPLCVVETTIEIDYNNNKNNSRGAQTTATCTQ